MASSIGCGWIWSSLGPNKSCMVGNLIVGFGA
jgi:hypothetical protein